MSTTRSAPHPRRRDDVTVTVSDDRTVLRAADDSVHVLNPTAHALWVLCDGRTTPTEMAEAVCDVFDISLDHAISDVVAGLDALVRDGLVEAGDS